jgi:hypothetical protein
MELLVGILGAVFVAGGLLVLWLVLDRWGRKHDPMKPTRFDFLTPGSTRRDRSSLDE